jgi:phosphopantothenoylcysteine decarboxylase/phosphopantothenate--cysteine ligase
MADPQLIELAAASLFKDGGKRAIVRRDWQGRRLLVTAGATEERIDAARLLSNRSSGRMGVFVAQAARLRGAEVDLIHGPLQVPSAWLEGLNAHPITSSQDLERELIRHQPAADAVAMLAAVADLRRCDGGLAEKPSKQELPGLMQAGWQEVPDLLRGLVVRRPPGQRLLGFAALTGSDEELLSRGEEKRIHKGCDLLFVNPIDRPDQGFAVDRNGGWLLGEGTAEQLPVRSKLVLAHDLLDRLLALKPCLQERPTSC